MGKTVLNNEEESMLVRGNGRDSLPVKFRGTVSNTNYLSNSIRPYSKPVKVTQPVAFGDIVTFVGKKLQEAIEKPLTLLYMSDTHKNIDLLPNLKTAIDSVKKNTDEPLILHSGDFGMGPEGLELQVEILNKLGVNLATTGNHEYYSGVDKLSQILNKSEFKTIVTNLEVPKANPLSNLFDNGKMVKSLVKEVNGKKYGFVGAVTQSLNKEGYEHLLKGVKATDVISALAKEVQELEKQGVDRIILVSHSGYNVDKKIAQQVPGIDVIVGGHSHIGLRGIKKDVNLFESPRNKEPVLVVHPGAYAEALGITHLVFNDKGILQVQPSKKASKYLIVECYNQLKELFSKKKIKDINTTDNRLLEVANFAQDKEVSEIIKKELDTYTKIGTIDKPIGGDFINDRASEIGSLTADAVRKYTGAQIALVHSGSFRRGINKGPVYAEFIINHVCPYNGKVVKVELTGRELLSALNTGAKTAGTLFKPGLLQVSGLKYAVDMKRHENARVIPEELMIKNGKNYEPVDLNKVYTVAYDDFVLNGGDGFEPLKDAKVSKRYADLTYAKALINHIKDLNQSHKPITPDCKDRIVLKNYSQKDGIFDKLLSWIGLKIKSRIDKFVFEG